MPKTVYFGNLRKAFNLPAPKSGMGAPTAGRIEEDTLANGGAFTSQSTAAHRVYDMSWGATEQSLLRPLYDLRHGVYGTGLLYLCDPYVANALPPHWAEPRLSAEGWPSLVSAGNRPTLVGEGTARTNYSTDPNAATLSQWTVASASGTAPTLNTVVGSPGTVYGATYARLTAQTAAVQYEARAAATFPVVAGEGYAYSVYVRGTTSRNAQLRLTWTGATATSGTSTAVASTTAWQRLSMTGTVPAGATAVRLDIVGVATSVVVGNYIEFDGVLYERGTTTVGTYFDGATVYTDGRTASWASTANASYSTTWVPNANMPLTSAQYDLSGPLGANLPVRAAVLLIPPTKTLHVGFSGSSVNGGGVYALPINLDGSAAMPQALTLLSPSGSTRINTSFSGATYSAVLLYLDTTTVGASSVTLNSAIALYRDTSAGAPTLTGTHVGGEGHTGLRFKGEITRTYILQRPDGTSFITAATEFTEVGAWL